MTTRTTAIIASCFALTACSSSTSTDGSPGTAAGHAGVLHSGTGGTHSGGTKSGGTTANGGKTTGGASANGGAIGGGGAAAGGTIGGGSPSSGGTNPSGGTFAASGAPTGGTLAVGGTRSQGGYPAIGGSYGSIAGNAGNAQAGATSASGSSGAAGAAGAPCVKTPGSNAGTVCIGCGVQIATYYNCDGTRYRPTTEDWQFRSNNALCLTSAHCGTDAAYWTKNNAGANGATCDQFCQGIGATCANACTAFSVGVATDPCPASTTAGYNQYETYGCESDSNNQCGSTVVHPNNAFNAFCCCRGLGTTVGGGNCVETEGSAAGTVCVGCGYKAKTYFHCDGTRYVSTLYADYSSDPTCLSEKLCGNTQGPAWARNTNGESTCSAFCSSINAKCVNACTAFSSSGATSPCPASTTAGYNQYETYGCESGANNQCNSTVLHPSNAYNAYCCCQVL
ncbi:MAG TPA: hypothetical protein VKP30_01990 [Polyangiaceae bacterium]|nr:hypothetical protein [Polyangiaceae bacterium]